MPLSVFIKDSAEISASYNWLKEQLDNCKLFFTDSIEGYTVDDSLGVILLMDRAKVDFEEVQSLTHEEIIQNIIIRDGKGSISRKICLAKLFKIDFRYLLYSESPLHHVWVFKFNADGIGSLEIEFTSFSEFGIWLDSHRTMTISKGYGHPNVNTYHTSQFSDLPHFDQTLRENGTPWLANIDGFISDKSGRPLALLEYQNTSKSPYFHSNNLFFLRGDDINRFKSMEIAKLHSGLPFFILVWSKDYSGFRIKELECCSYPISTDGSVSLEIVKKYLPSHSKETYYSICNHVTTSSFSYNGRNLISHVNHPVLSQEDMSFPYIYFSHNQFYPNNLDFLDCFVRILRICPNCGARLIQRCSQYGPFIGCTSFPRCNYCRNSW